MMKMRYLKNRLKVFFLSKYFQQLNSELAGFKVGTQFLKRWKTKEEERGSLILTKQIMLTKQH